jgi:CheY-like chemotaxis protein
MRSCRPARTLQSPGSEAGEQPLIKFLDVLVVDDDVEDASAVARLLRQRHLVRIAVGLREAVHEVAKKVPDVIICAYEMPPYRGDALLAMVAREHPEVRRILFSRIPVGEFVSDEAVHAVVAKPVDQALLLAAVVGK